MKLALVAVVAFAAFVQCSAVKAVGTNVIDDLLVEALEYVRSMLAASEPFTLPDVPAQHIVDADADIQFKVSNVKISSASDFKVGQLETNLPNLWAKFDLTAPKPHIEGDFVLSGTAAGIPVSGDGSFSVDLTDMEQSGFVQLGVQTNGLYISDMTLDYSLANAKFSVTGINVKDMPEDKVNDFLNTHLLPTLEANKVETCKRVAAQIVIIANEIMDGKTLNDIIAWLKAFIGN